MTQTPCLRCEQLRAELRAARKERDAALLAVAIEREKANATLLSQAVPEPPPPKPLRYWAIDALSDGLKKALPWPHAGVRAAARLLRRTRKADR